MFCRRNSFATANRFIQPLRPSWVPKTIPAILSRLPGTSLNAKNQFAAYLPFNSIRFGKYKNYFNAFLR
jgi:hypothetical protein